MGTGTFATEFRHMPGSSSLTPCSFLPALSFIVFVEGLDFIVLAGALRARRGAHLHRAREEAVYTIKEVALRALLVDVAFNEAVYIMETLLM